MKPSDDGSTRQPPLPADPSPLRASDDRLWAALAHFGNIFLLVPALVIYVAFKDRGPRVRVEATEALNWTINASVVLGVLFGVQFVYLAIAGSDDTVFLVIAVAGWALYIVNLILAIVGGVTVNSSGSYRYPVNIRWIK